MAERLGPEQTRVLFDLMGLDPAQFSQARDLEKLIRLDPGPGHDHPLVTPTELKVLLNAYAASLGGIEALPRRGSRGGQPSLPQGWFLPYLHLIDLKDEDKGVQFLEERTRQAEITAEHIRQAEANLLRPRYTRRDTARDILAYLSLGVSIAMFGNVFAWSMANDVLQLQIVSGIGLIAMFVGFIALPHGIRR